MAGCCAVNCTSSHYTKKKKKKEKGKHSIKKEVRKHIKLYRFPADLVRRYMWAINTRRDKWFPTESSRLCEKHFEPSQFKADDPTKKLKQDAVPTLFDLHIPENGQKPEEQTDRKKKVLKPSTDAQAVIVEVVLPSEPVFERQAVVVTDPSVIAEVLEREIRKDHTYSSRKTPPLEEEENDCDEDVLQPLPQSPHCESCDTLGNEVAELKMKIQSLEDRISEFQNNITSFLSIDQINSLNNSQSKSKSKRKPKQHTWTDETITKALKLRCSVGYRGYEHLRIINYPLPSESVLCQKLAKSPFAPGILTEIIEWMGTAMENQNEQDKVCSLMIDAIPISQAIEVNSSGQTCLGYESPELRQPHQEMNNVASHALCFTVEGVSTRWRQIVGYYFAGDSIGGEQLWKVTQQLIIVLGQSGFKTVAVVSDMATCNQGMWEAAGIISNKFELVSEVPHPYYPHEKLHFLADVQHLMKDLGYDFLKHKVSMPQFVMQKYQLESQEVCSSHVKALWKIQDEKQLSVATHLTKKHIQPAQYQKLCIQTASEVLSHATARSICSMVESSRLKTGSLATAFFCQHFGKWFDVMNARHIKSAMFVNHANKKIDFLHEVMLLASDMQFPNDEWKPVQSGIRLSTASILSLYQRLCVEGPLEYLLPGRFTRDQLENLFRRVRTECRKRQKKTTGVKRNADLSPFEFRDMLKLISIANLMAFGKKSGHDSDDKANLMDYVKNHLTRLDLESKH